MSVEDKPVLGKQQQNERWAFVWFQLIQSINRTSYLCSFEAISLRNKAVYRWEHHANSTHEGLFGYYSSWLFLLVCVVVACFTSLISREDNWQLFNWHQCTSEKSDCGDYGTDCVRKRVVFQNTKKGRGAGMPITNWKMTFPVSLFSLTKS